MYKQMFNSLDYAWVGGKKCVSKNDKTCDK